MDLDQDDTPTEANLFSAVFCIFLSIVWVFLKYYHESISLPNLLVARFMKHFLSLLPSSKMEIKRFNIYYNEEKERYFVGCGEALGNIRLRFHPYSYGCIGLDIMNKEGYTYQEHPDLEVFGGELERMEKVEGRKVHYNRCLACYFVGSKASHGTVNVHVIDGFPICFECIDRKRFRSKTIAVEVPRSNPWKNHDHMKRSYATYKEANNEVKRMRRLEYSGSERLTVYYNEEFDKYFVGKKKYS